MNFLRIFSMKHGTHHSLTPVFLKSNGNAEGKVVNRYPIIHRVQHKSATFPVYAPFAFLAAFSPLIAFLQWLFPGLPITLPGALALVFSYASYEVLHSTYHRPYHWWKKWTEHPSLGLFWKKVYGFHLGHHANPMCNQAVGGFFGLPLADMAFGTLKIPRVSLADNSTATAEDFAEAVPCRLIRWLDRRALAHEKRLMLGK
jgi:hemolysin III